jgi:hypothetical protein
MRQNWGAFVEMAKLKEGEQSRLLFKASGAIKHGGKQVVSPDSAAYRILTEFVRRVNAPSSPHAVRELPEDNHAPPFFGGIVMLDDRKLLRRATLSLAGRLPDKTELFAVEREGLKALPKILDAVFQEDAFYDRLREGFNDIFLTVGYDDVPENALSYEHFSKTRGWNQKFDLSHIADEKARTKAGYKLSDDYRNARPCSANR